MLDRAETCRTCSGRRCEPGALDDDAALTPCRACGGSGQVCAAPEGLGRLELPLSFWAYSRSPRVRVVAPEMEMADG